MSRLRFSIFATNELHKLYPARDGERKRNSAPESVEKPWKRVANVPGSFYNVAMHILLANYNIVVQIDDDYLPEFSRHRWRYNRRTRRLTRYEGGRTIFIYRDIMDAPDGVVVDHVDGNPLNNCRANLRLVTKQQNLWNVAASGVSARGGKWRATIQHNGKKLELGQFTSKEDAQRARDVASLVLRGDHGRINNPIVNLEGFPAHLFAPAARRILTELVRW